MDKSKVRTHLDLDAWQFSIDLVEDIYSLSGKFPNEERYGLTSQLRRAVLSVPSNIAEGAARRSNKEYIHFLYSIRGIIGGGNSNLTC